MYRQAHACPARPWWMQPCGYSRRPLHPPALVVIMRWPAASQLTLEHNLSPACQAQQAAWLLHDADRWHSLAQVTFCMCPSTMPLMPRWADGSLKLNLRCTQLPAPLWPACRSSVSFWQQLRPCDTVPLPVCRHISVQADCAAAVACPGCAAGPSCLCLIPGPCTTHFL
jgi:hypothetical protein